METKKLGFIGGGRITRIILQAFQNKSVDFDSVVVFEPNKETAKRLKIQYPGIDLAETPEAPARQNILFLAVHPPVMMETIGQIKGAIDENTVIISLAPKITIEKMAAQLNTVKIVRMIPNATSYINKGINPVTFHSGFQEEEKDPIMGILKILGKTVEEEEKMLEGYAIVSAMLPTYFWFQWKKMEELAMKMGFKEADARKLIRSTLRRSIKLYYSSQLTPDDVMDLIPVKPIGEHEEQIREIFEHKLLGLYEKIKP